MGGYASKLKGKIKSKWKAKFGSSSKPVEQSTLNSKPTRYLSNEQIIKEQQLMDWDYLERPMKNEESDGGAITEGKKVIEDDSVMNSYFKKGSFSPMEMPMPTLKGEIGNALKQAFPIQEGEKKTPWKSALPTLNQSMAQKMAKNANSTTAQLEKVENEETERFNAAHWDALLESYIGTEAYNKYTSNFYYTIMNTLARTGKPPKTAWDDGKEVQVTKEAAEIAMKALQAMSEDMREGLFSQLEEDRIVYRGVGSNYGDILRDQLGIGDEVTGEELNRKLKGNVIFDKAFTSTSLDPNVAHDFAERNSKMNGKNEATIIQIHAPKGLKAKYLTPISEFGDEAELLIDQNTPLRILDVTMVEDSKTGTKYRLVKAEFLSFYIGSHRASVSNNYDLQKVYGNDMKSQGGVPQVRKG